MINIRENILLRPLESDDASDIFNAIDSQREYLGQWLPFVAHSSSPDFIRSFVNSSVTHSAMVVNPTFTVRVDGEFAGLIGLKDTDTLNRKTEVGYWLCAKFQGKGVMTGAVKALCMYAFEEMKLNRIQIKCAVGNIKSSAIPKRLGFRFEGVERAGELFPDSTFHDLEVYSLLQSESVVLNNGSL